MESSGRYGTRFGLALLGAGLFLVIGAAAPAGAQNQVGAGSGAGDEVARNLRTLAANPRSVAALMGAGKASLAVGDPQAALTFFARAEEILPRDGRIKMWIGSALVQLEQPRPALKFFEEAARLGVAEADFAGDRGLVHDMLGDPRRAQRDYELALRGGANPEITRRLALSLGISGERERALQLLEPQLLVRDLAAERTRALVLALTGDSTGAHRAAQAAMPGGQADAMAPFFARLPSLSPAERALAVHFGHFPGQGAPAPTTYASLEPVTSAGAPDSSQPPLGTRRTQAPVPPSTAPRRRPDAGQAATEPVRTVTTPAKPPARTAATENPAVTLAARDAQAEPEARQVDPPSVAATSAQPVAGPPPAPVAAETEPEPASSAESDRIAALEAALEAIGDDQPAAAPVKPAKPPAAPARTSRTAANAGATAQRERAASATAKKPAPPREASRVWVQIAGGANRTALPREFARLKAKAPKLLGSRAAWTVPINATNRLLVGPFAGNREAQAFINELAKSDVAGFAWTSAAGQKVERLSAR